jgi:hypothetical protein
MTGLWQFSILSFFGLSCVQLTAADQSVSATVAEHRVLGLNDVAILLPYNEHPDLFTSAPEITEKPSIAGDGQSFVPSWILKKIGETNAEDFNLRSNELFNLELNSSLSAEEQSEYDNLLPTEVRSGVNEGIFLGSQLKFAYRLTSVRFDPCADALVLRAANLIPDQCRAEIRLVWQAVQKNAQGRFAFVDNNIHAIYSLSSKDFAVIAQKLRSLKTGSLSPYGQALSPQPDIAAEGSQGQYYRGLNAIVQEYAHANRLTHLAFVAQTAAGGHWTFLKFAIEGRKATAQFVPSSSSEHLHQKSVQRLTLTSFDGLGTPSPIGAHADNIYKAVDAKDGLERANRLENPRLHDASDLDCASCHTIDHQKKILLNENPRQYYEAAAYRSEKWNLSARYPIPNFVSLQIFSYFPPVAVRIAARVIHEAAETCDFIETYY